MIHWTIVVLMTCELANGGAIFENVTVSLASETRMTAVNIQSDDRLADHVAGYAKVIVDKQSIPRLATDSASDLTDVVYLTLRQSRLRVIEVGSLRNLPKLKELDLSGNCLTEIQDGVFADLPFETLYLYGNKITTIGDVAFNGLSMVYLFIDDNKLSSWKSDWFSGTPLTAVSMGKNLLSVLPSHSFEYLWQFKYRNYHLSLTYLMLNDNSLTEIHPDAFVGLDEILTLNLHNNSIEYLPSELFDTVQYIDMIDLSNNKIAEVNPDLFKNTQVSQASFRNNQLTCISPDIVNVTNVETVRAEGNPLTCECVEEWRRLAGGDEVFEIGDYYCPSASGSIRLSIQWTISSLIVWKINSLLR